MSEVTQTFAVGGMTCGGCASKVEGAAAGVAGVKRVRVDLDAAQVTVTSDDGVDASAVRDAVGGAGDYRVTGPEAPTGSADAMGEAEDGGDHSLARYRPLAIIVGYIVLGSALPIVAGGTSEGALGAFMANFMGGFFLVFSFFKMLDLRGFAGSFRMYDPIAKAVPAYSFAYPFIELALGAAYIARFQMTAVYIITLVVMTIGAVGISVQLARGRAIKCACLGTVIDLPLGRISLFEDVLMAGMALAMLLM